MGVKLFVKALCKHWWALMSCAIFTAIGIYGAWKEKTNHWYVSASLLAGLLLFLVAAFRAWNEERKGREKAEDTLKDEAPRMNLEYSDELAKQAWDHSGLVVRNGGKTDGFKIHLASAVSTNGHARLNFEQMPIERISPGKWAPVKVRTDYRAEDDRWIPISGMDNIQIESCLERANEDIPVTISYTDYKGKEYTTACVIRRDGKFILTKRVWCELR